MAATAAHFRINFFVFAAVADQALEQLDGPDSAPARRKTGKLPKYKELDKKDDNQRRFNNRGGNRGKIR